MRSVYMGDCRLGGGTVRYHLLVEEVEGLGENYGVQLEGSRWRPSAASR